jgi:signal transduction histidine kinase
MLLLLQNHSLFRRLRIATDLVPGLPTVALDRAAWEHVILELLTNAQEAMPDGGSVRISTRLLSGECRLQTPRGYPDCGLEEPGDPNRKSQIENRKSAGCVEVIVKDDGPGIAPENLRQIFDPFFTTKGAGRGMGLGLRVCRDIVANHGGRLRVESDGKRGTRVVIELPLSKESHDGAGSNGRGNGDALLDTLGF